MQASTPFPTVLKRNRALEANGCNFSVQEPVPRPAPDAIVLGQQLQQPIEGLSFLHLRELERLEQQKEDAKNFQPYPDYKRFRRVASCLLQLLSAVGSGKLQKADIQSLEQSVLKLVTEYVASEITPFDANCALAVLFDRGELGICLPDVVDLLPHNTPGSYSWFQRVVASDISKVFLMEERFHRKLHAAGITYDHLDLLKSCCDNYTARCGTICPIISFKRSVAPSVRQTLVNLASINGLGFHRSEGRYSFTRDDVPKALAALLIGHLADGRRELEQVGDAQKCQ